ncbi:hypothetical protein Adt_09654 [Abeliophyllum distichum]|uniref:Uncharacterized protein n=1 Tax=Abeliophyllum distichum TaxID=126358 RepID=A0ABD1UJ66_9LAMI
MGAQSPPQPPVRNSLCTVRLGTITDRRKGHPLSHRAVVFLKIPLKIAPLSQKMRKKRQPRQSAHCEDGEEKWVTQEWKKRRGGYGGWGGIRAKSIWGENRG